ncbi:MAG: protein kinase [Archangium sp.]
MASEGEQLGRYHLVRKLATGGMAEVFLAKVIGPGGFEKSLVIKRILPTLAKDESFVSMFLQEARIAAQFAHPAVVQIFDFGEVNGTYFLAMEFVDGPNLRSILRASPDRRIPLAVGARVIEEACEGLAYVHEFADASGKPMGLIHCDVSTDNMLIARNGAVKVVDFGIAKTGAQAATFDGTVKGKIAYMPPEQIIGEADLRADVYALGVILYEFAAGTRPYEQVPDQQLIADIIKTDPVPLTRRVPDVPREYANIVAKAMAKNLNVRFQNCRELASALEEFVAGSGVRVGTRQLASLATQYQEEPASSPNKPGTSPTPASVATPYVAKQLSPSRISPPSGVPAAGGDPFAAFGAPMARTTQPLPPPPAVSPPTPVAAKPVVPPLQSAAAKKHSEELFDQFFSDVDMSGLTPIATAAVARPSTQKLPPPPPPPAAKKDDDDDDGGGMRITVGSTAAAVPIEAFNARGTAGPLTPGTKSRSSGSFPQHAPSSLTPGPGKGLPLNTPGPGRGLPMSVASAPPPPAISPHTPGPGRGLPISRPPTPGPGQGLPLAPPPSRSGGFAAHVPAQQQPPNPVASTPEVRAAVVMADATTMRLYDTGPGLGTAVELESVRKELARDEGLHLLVRYADHAARLLKYVEPESLVSERLAGAIDGLFMAEAWGTLATLLERLKFHGEADALHKWAYDFAISQFATTENARRISLRLRENKPADAEGLGKLIAFFGPAFGPTWISLFENIDLAASRDALLPGLASLCALSPQPFIDLLAPKRPRRIMELVYCLEKGRVGDRSRIVRELLARLDPARRREVLTGLARAGSDDAYKLVCQGVTDEESETRLHSIQLLGKHFPERVLAALKGVVEPNNASTRTDQERRALWISIGQSNSPEALSMMASELAQRPLLGRAKSEGRKVEVLEGLAVMKGDDAASLMQRVNDDSSQGDSVRAAADRHLRSAALIAETTSHVGELRRWDRNPPAWRDVLMDLHALSQASRLVELDSELFDTAFTRISKTLAALLPAGAQASVTTSPSLTVNGAPVGEGNDGAVERVKKAFESRGVAGFTFTRQPPRAELELLVRWLAAGANAEGIETSSITLVSANNQQPKPAKPDIRPSPMTDFSREAMIRYVDLVLGFRAWMTERKMNPRAEMPDVRQVFHEVATAAHSRMVRFAGLTPRKRNAEAEVFHAANVMMLAVMFGGELGLEHQQLMDLAQVSFFSEVGNFDLKDEMLERAGKLTEADQQAIAAARKTSVRFPFVKLGDAPAAASWSSILVEQDLDWGTRERPGSLGAMASIGLMGSIVALARAYESLSTATASREAMPKDQIVELIGSKVAHRFRPEVVQLFVRFLQRQSLKPVAK